MLCASLDAAMVNTEANVAVATAERNSEIKILTVLNLVDGVGANQEEETRAPQAPSAPAVLLPTRAMAYSRHSLHGRCSLQQP